MAREGRLLNIAQFAAAFAVTDDAVRLWCRDGLVPGAFQTPGGRWRIPEESIATVRERGTPAPAAESSAA